MKLVYSRIDGNNLVEFFVDEDCCVTKVVADDTGNIIEEEVINGLCGCSDCRVNTDWSKL